jgi:hypothetical protein
MKGRWVSAWSGAWSGSEEPSAKRPPTITVAVVLFAVSRTENSRRASIVQVSNMDQTYFLLDSPRLDVNVDAAGVGGLGIGSLR